MATTVIIDLSHHNPEPDWSALKGSGVVGVILKATEGTGYVDPTYHARRLDAEVAGLVVNSYHYLKPGNIGLQMLHYLDTVTPQRGERVIVDYEDAGSTLDELELAVATLRATGLGLQVTVYGGGKLKAQLGGDHNEKLAQASLWIAHYTPHAAPSWPRGTWPVWSLWQYTDKALASGISERVDGNRFNGPAGNALKWMSPAVQAAPPVKLPVPDREPEVELSLVIDPGVRFAIYVNGHRYALTSDDEA